MTQVSPLKVRLNGDTVATDAVGPAGLSLDTEVVIDNLEGRRFVVYPPGADHQHTGFLATTGKAADSDLLDGLDSTSFPRRGRVASGVVGGESTVGGLASLNAHLTTGVYEINGSTSAPTLDWYLLDVLTHTNPGNGTTYQRQVAYQMTGVGGGATGNPNGWTRACDGGDPTVAASWSPWRQFAGDTGWVTPTTLNGHIHYQGNTTGSADFYGPVQLRRIGPIVHMRGLINASAATADFAFNLPAGMNPDRFHIFAGWSSATTMREFRVQGGQVLCYFRDSWCSLACSWNTLA